MLAVESRDARYQYPDDPAYAVDGVSFTVNPGEFVAILGHNGSGKSTLAKLINALFIPGEGSVIVCGIDTRESARVIDVRRSAGMVFQNPDNQLVATIVEEDVAFGLENLGTPPDQIRKRVDEALAMVGMGEFASAAPHKLSGGQKQRVAIAGVLAMRPRMIIFDESTAMLDPSGRREVMQIVRMLNRQEGITVLWITHFMEEAVGADRVIVMDEGKIVMEGKPREVFENTTQVRGHGLDVPAMTELAAQLRAEGIELPSGILSVDEMVVELCRLR